MSQHTPAPWVVGNTRTHSNATVTFNEVAVHCASHDARVGHGNCIATVHLGGVGATDIRKEAVLANANLIAAAPKLLAALRAVVSSATPKAYEHPAMHLAWEIAKEAIAKAEGGKP